jgi:hypothetical protein
MKLFTAGIVIGLVLGTTVGAGARIGSYFYTVDELYQKGTQFQYGYVSGVYDGIQFIANIADKSGLNEQALVSTANCLDHQGDTVGEFTKYASRAVGQVAKGEVAAGAIISGCVPR